jgi:hypothetical protein
MAEMTWAEAVAQVAGVRTKAESSAALLKKFGDSGHVARGQLFYCDAKGETDAVIAGLIVALSAKEEPESLPSLQERVEPPQPASPSCARWRKANFPVWKPKISAWATS